MARSLGGVLCCNGTILAIKHERYYLFPPGTIVVIRLHIVFPSWMPFDRHQLFDKYYGRETTIKCQFDQACTVDIDGGHSAWGYDWIDLKEEFHSKDELFEI